MDVTWGVPLLSTQYVWSFMLFNKLVFFKLQAVSVAQPMAKTARKGPTAKRKIQELVFSHLSHLLTYILFYLPSLRKKRVLRVPRNLWFLSSVREATITALALFRDQDLFPSDPNIFPV